MSPEPRKFSVLKPVAGRWWRPFARSGDAAVLHVDLAPHGAREAEALAWLSADERSRWNRIRHAGRRREYALCRAALRAVLCARLGCSSDELSFEEARRGKPHARLRGAPAPISFSVSHSGGHGLLAVARGGRLGVDVEERVPRRDLDALIAAVLTPIERAEIEAAGAGERIGRFYGLWTIKEALVKALGTGLQLDLAGFEVPPAMRRGVTDGIFRFPHLPSVTWRVENLGNEEFAAAVAHEWKPEPRAGQSASAASRARRSVFSTFP